MTYLPQPQAAMLGAHFDLREQVLCESQRQLGNTRTVLMDFSQRTRPLADASERAGAVGSGTTR
jgi:hypothetical protein